MHILFKAISTLFVSIFTQQSQAAFLVQSKAPDFTAEAVSPDGWFFIFFLLFFWINFLQFFWKILSNFLKIEKIRNFFQQKIKKKPSRLLPPNHPIILPRTKIRFVVLLSTWFYFCRIFLILILIFYFLIFFCDWNSRSDSLF